MNTLTENSTLPEIRAALAEIKASLYTQRTYSDGPCHCAMGWINYMCGGVPHYSEIENQLLDMSAEFIISTHDEGENIMGVNDGRCKAYPQPTPKARVLALLDDMIAAGVALQS